MLKKYQIHLLVLLGLMILSLVFFAINLNDFFLSDDFDWLYLTKTSQHNIGDYFTANYFGDRGVGGSYRPMVNLIFWTNYHLFGLNPLPYHLTNLLFQIGVCVLVYFLALILFADNAHKQKIAVLAAVFFSLLPNHSEAVIWIAAIADPVAAFFYLLAFYCYLLFRHKEKFYWLLISVFSFIVALLTKEFAVTLPLLIVVWELYQALSKNKFKWQDIILKPFGYWLLMIAYFGLRYFSIGLLFGYYADAKFRLDLGKIFNTFIALVTNLLFYSQWRVVLTDFFVNNKIFFVLLLFLIVTVILYVLRKNFLATAFLIDAYIISILAVLPLGFNNFTDEGERYNYLPSVFFCLLLSLLICKVITKSKLKILVISTVLVYFSVFLINKNYNWHLAGQLAQKMIKQDLPQLVDLNKHDSNLLFVSLPDNLDGAQVFRNAVSLAIKLYYPDFQFDAQVANAYLRLTRQIYKEKILYWGPYPTGGYIAKTFDQKNWVTGFATRYTDNYDFELWGYNYDNYTSDTIRLMIKGDYFQAQQEGNLQILIYNEGALQQLK